MFSNYESLSMFLTFPILSLKTSMKFTYQSTFAFSCNRLGGKIFALFSHRKKITKHVINLITCFYRHMFYILFKLLQHKVLCMYWLFTGSFKAWFPLRMNVRHRSSHSKVFCKKGVFRNIAKFTGKHLCQSFFLNKVVGLQLY